ncbi:MAG TPA: SDR family oxidoreductase [Solirubrobacteraceae bacterium]|nr:SDR family oxidoreductase [Solirubrobacteraceae bacterium]
MGDHTGQAILVTGASRGIGRAIAERFAGRGARLALVATNAGRLEHVAAELPAGAGATAIAADLTDPAECRRAVREAEDALGPLDVLVHNAGVLSRDFVEDVAEADFERAWRLNTGAALWLSQAALPGMRARRRGAIVLVSSELGIIGAPTYASYCSSKWGQLALAEVLRHELVGSGVQVCAVCPADVRTDQLQQEHAWGPTGGQPPAKALSPDAVARAVVRAAEGTQPLIVVDRPLMALGFRIMAGPRRLRFGPVHDAFKQLLAERRPRATAERA